MRISLVLLSLCLTPAVVAQDDSEARPITPVVQATNGDFHPKVEAKSREFTAGEMNLITISGITFETYANSKVLMYVYPKDGSIQLIDNLSVSQKRVVINIQPRKKGPNLKYWFVFVIGGTGDFVFLEYPFTVIDREVVKDAEKQKEP